MTRFAPVLFLLGALLPGTVGQASGAPQDQEPSPAAIEFFEKKIRPLLADNCYKCHSARAKKLKAGLYADSRAGLVRGGDTGPAIVPGHPGKSLLVKAIGYADEDLQMPPKQKLEARQIEDLVRWIKMGAPWPGGVANAPKKEEPRGITDEDRAYWAYQRLSWPEPPAVKNGAWGRSPLDAFILAKLEANGLSPAPPADRRTLIRRATYDLTGLPPTPEEVDAFVKDPDPKAYEKLVDRLLLSPRYGEKWGRHWLDLVRFAETNGYERDSNKPHAWRYRDYVIRSFNNDKPYDRFLLEQLAGDELENPDADAIIATGFYRLGIWDDEPADRELAMYDGLDDVLSTTGQVMLGMTLGCVRCHGHKRDPIPHEDYYRMLAFIRNISPNGKGGNNIERVINRNEAVHKAHEEKIRRAQEEVDRIEADFRTKLTTGSGTTLHTDLEDLRYRFYRSHWEKLPEFDAIKPEREGQVPHNLFDISLASRRADFGFVFTGKLAVPRKGSYTFYLNSDDGARLIVNGKKVVEWDGIHGVGKPHKAAMALPKGRVEIRLEYFQALGGLGLIVEWQGPGVKRRLLSTPSGDAKKRFSDLIKQRGAEILGPRGYRGYLKLKRDLDRLKKNSPGDEKALCVTEPPRVQDTFVLARGNPRGKSRKVQPGFPRVLGFKDPSLPKPGKTTGRRTVLARWIVSPENPLTARVIANRLWQHHFGRGIVPTPNDFGKLGRPPTHPKLLAWLASEVVARGWKLKAMHKLIMTSSAYRMSAKDDPKALAKDGANMLFWRFNMRRLTSEEIRDSILAVNGTLNLKMFGPSVFPPIPAEVLATASRPKQAWGKSSPEDAVRRSIYIKVKRSLLHPLMAAYDFADTDASTAVRFATTVPTQALTLLNSDFMSRQAAVLAERLRKEAPGDVRGQISRALRLVTQRTPEAREVARGAKLIADLRKTHRFDGTKALNTFCLLALNLNEFVYLD